MNNFQLEKQQKLNELDIVVTLQLHQIEHVINGSLPSDLSKCLVFDAPGLSSLKHRIKELEQERNYAEKTANVSREGMYNNIMLNDIINIELSGLPRSIQAGEKSQCL